MIRVSNGLGRMSDANLSLLNRSIINKMTGNSYFPSPEPTLTAVQAAADNFDTALLAAKTGSYTAVSEKNARKAELATLLHRLSEYVMFAAKGDETALVSSGFPLTRIAAPQPPLTKPDGLTISAGVNAGELEVSVNRLAGARSYQFQYTPDPVLPDSSWSQQIVTTRSTVLAGLESGKRYWCRVNVTGTNGQMVCSDAMCSVVL